MSLVLGCSVHVSTCSQDASCRVLLQVGKSGTAAGPPLLEEQLRELEGALKGLELAESLQDGHSMPPASTPVDHLLFSGDGRHVAKSRNSSGIADDYSDMSEAEDAAQAEHSVEAAENAQGAGRIHQHVPPSSSVALVSFSSSSSVSESVRDKLDKIAEAVDSLGSSIDITTLACIITSHVIIGLLIVYCIWRHVPLPSWDTVVHYCYLFGLSSILLALQLHVFAMTGMLADTWQAVAPYIVASCLVCTCIGPVCCRLFISYHARWVAFSAEMHQMADALRSMERSLGFEVEPSKGAPARRGPFHAC